MVAGVKTPLDPSQCQKKIKRSSGGVRVVAASKAPPPTERRGVPSESERRQFRGVQSDGGRSADLDRKSTSTDT